MEEIRMREEEVRCGQGTPNGFTQKEVGSTGSWDLSVSGTDSNWERYCGSGFVLEQFRSYGRGGVRNVFSPALFPLRLIKRKERIFKI